MDVETIDRLSRRIGRPGPRRTAIAVLLGTALLERRLASAEKPEAGKEPAGSTRSRRKKTRRRGRHRRARAQATARPGNHCLSPSGTDLISDFLAKFEGVKYVIDPGTKHEKSEFVGTNSALFVVDREADLDIVSPTPLGTLNPLPVGPHVVEAYWVFGDVHCDGLGSDPALQCFPPGDTLFHTVAFTVTPGHN